MAERRIADIGPLLEDLKKELKDLEGSTEVLTVEEAAEDEIEELKALPVIDPTSLRPTAKWVIMRRMADGWTSKRPCHPWEHPVLTVDAYGNYHTNTEYIDTPEIPFCITYNDGRFWPPIAWSKFEPLKQGGD